MWLPSNGTGSASYVSAPQSAEIVRFNPETDSDMAQRAVPVTLRRATRLSIGRDPLLNLIEIFLEPLVFVLSLWVVAFAIEGRLVPQDMILSLIVFSLTFPGPSRLTM